MRETPGWLYERLPYIYVATGAVATTGLELRSAGVAGIVLILAGLGIIRLRLQYRLRSTQQIRFRLGALR